MSENDKHSFLNSLKVTQEAGLPKTDLQKEQEEMHNVLLSYLDTYEDKNSIKAKKYLCYLTAAIYLTYRKMYPNLVTRIPFRTKADLSYMKNIQKEFIKSIVEYLNNCSEYGKTFTLENFDEEVVDMFSIVIVGNSQSFVKEGKFITPRGYDVELRVYN